MAEQSLILPLNDSFPLSLHPVDFLLYDVQLLEGCGELDSLLHFVVLPFKDLLELVESFHLPCVEECLRSGRH